MSSAEHKRRYFEGYGLAKLMDPIDFHNIVFFTVTSFVVNILFYFQTGG